MIRAFLFDIGNVLLRFDFTLAARKIAAQSDVSDPVEALALIDRVKPAYEDGQIDRAAFLRGAADAIGFRGTDADFIAAWEEIFELNEPMAALVAQLAPRFPLYLLSNTNDIHHAYFTRRYPVFAHFRGGTFSHVVRASKPGREIYEIACREHGLEPATTFFIDDLLPNIETARALGFQTHHYHAAQHAALLAQIRTFILPLG
ncbi:MAG: HAD family phosphatase [Chthoniobacteraceae bacterium]